MIDRQALKTAAKQSMRGKKPNTYFVAAIFISIVGVLMTLVFSLTGYDKLVDYIAQIQPVNPYPSYTELAAMIEPIQLTAFLLIVAILILKSVLDVGFMSYCLKLSRNIQTEIKTLFDGFDFLLKIIWLEILKTVFITLWSGLLVFPGIIAYYRYRQAFYILLDNPTARPIDCIRESKRMMDGYKFDLFVLDLSFFGWFVIDYLVAAMATVRLFSIWLAPYVGIVRADFYNRLVSEDTSVSETG